MHTAKISDAEFSAADSTLRRVLVVDDSRLQLRIITGILDRLGFEVMQASSGQEALEICRRTPPDLVLSDWMMPGMDGLEFCRHFRDMPRQGYGYFILLTSKSEKGEIARGLDAGADDFLTKPVNSDELRARINAGARVIAMQQQLCSQNRMITETLDRLQAVYDEIDRDLQQARTIQQALVPDRSRVFGTSRVSMLLKPCGHVGGDLVGAFASDYAQIGAYGIDVSGHGITSALVTARVAGYLSSLFPEQNLAFDRDCAGFSSMRRPEHVAQLLNERLSADPGVAEYMTMAFAKVDLRTGRTRLVQAGHPPPLLLKADGGTRFLGDGGLPIGLVDEVCYDPVDFVMAPGDRLLIYSDGFTEAELSNGGMLGEDGLLDIVADCDGHGEGPEFLDDLFWRLSKRMDHEQSLQDDVSATLVEFDMLGGAQPQ
ncbi:fused response regulator/phosphatase [Aestuariicoccus sp. MJ-SS9]|uniref:PP2C family protein-serine/threonine phosphatase n=1 Tax=Aestuariicoccus sp. MJ-SS9 TaxID=3079855 RepID=UPI0029133899|nr:fused response regulator/phosphatase [Aestuariicoccus sp. MJ-SS9]MDU8910887.1 fused response regulator/phosphatase [Aestuariicoccus sp. MJ-SS9]